MFMGISYKSQTHITKQFLKMLETFREFVSFQLNEPLKQIGGAGSPVARREGAAWQLRLRTGAAPKIWKSCNQRKDPASSTEVLGQILPGQALCGSR